MARDSIVDLQLLAAMDGLAQRQVEERAEDSQPGNASDYSAKGAQTYLGVLLALSVMAVALRFWSRSLGERGRQCFWWDDWMALASLIPLGCLAGCIYAMFDHGLGYHTWTLSEYDQTTQLKLLYAANFMFDLTICVTKSCALLFFNRVFPSHANSKWFNWTIKILHSMNIGWLIGICVATFFLCIPMEASYNPNVMGDCHNQVPVYIGSAISSVVIDFVILLVPLPKIWRLQMSAGKKGGLMVVFLLGYSVIIVSLGRMVSMVKKAEPMRLDPSYQFATMLFWLLAEGPTTLISACLPAMMPLARRGLGKFTTAFTTRGSNNSRTTHGGAASKMGLASFRDDGAPGIAMHPYSTMDEQPASKGGAKDDVESFGSSESTRGILPPGIWHTSRVERGSRSVADATATPDNRIRVHKGFAVHQQD